MFTIINILLKYIAHHYSNTPIRRLKINYVTRNLKYLCDSIKQQVFDG